MLDADLPEISEGFPIKFKDLWVRLRKKEKKELLLL